MGLWMNLLKITFRQIYEFIKGQPEFVHNKDIPQSGCLCEICENVVYIAKAMSNVRENIPTNPDDLVELYSCDSSNRSCSCTTQKSVTICFYPFRLTLTTLVPPAKTAILGRKIGSNVEFASNGSMNRVL